MAIGKQTDRQARNGAGHHVSSYVIAMAVLGMAFCTSAAAQTTNVPNKPVETAVQKHSAEGYVKLTQSAVLRERAARDEAYKKKLCGKIKSQLENFESHQRMGRAPLMLRMRL